MPQDLQILLALIGVGGIGLGAAITGLLSKIPVKGETAKTIVSQVNAENVRLVDRNEDLTRTVLLQSDYIHDLRGHISEKKDPPPPGYPEGLKQ